eukprot:601489-Hanusia_phi.AAC.6
MRGRRSDLPLNVNSVGFSSPLKMNSPQVFSVYNPQSRPVKSMMKDFHIPSDQQTARQQEEQEQAQAQAQVQVQVQAPVQERLLPPESPSPSRCHGPETGESVSLEQVVSFLRDFAERRAWQKVLSRRDPSGGGRLDQRQFEGAVKETGIFSLLHVSAGSLWDRAVGKSFRTSGVDELATMLSILCAEERIRLLASECSFVDKVCTKIQGTAAKGDVLLSTDSEDSLEIGVVGGKVEQLKETDIQPVSEHEQHDSPWQSHRLANQVGDETGVSASRPRESLDGSDVLQQGKQESEAAEYAEKGEEEKVEEGVLHGDFDLSDAPSPQAAAAPMEYPRADGCEMVRDNGKGEDGTNDISALALQTPLAHPRASAFHRKQREFSQKEFKAANTSIDRQSILQRLVRATSSCCHDLRHDSKDKVVTEGRRVGADEVLAHKFVRFELRDDVVGRADGSSIMQYIAASQANAETSRNSSDEEQDVEPATCSPIQDKSLDGDIEPCSAQEGLNALPTPSLDPQCCGDIRTQTEPSLRVESTPSSLVQDDFGLEFSHQRWNVCAGGGRGGGEGRGE